MGSTAFARSNRSRKCRVIFCVLAVLSAITSVAKAARAEWPIDTLHKFVSGTEGDLLWGGLLIDSKGYIYGTDTTAGTKGYGSVFRLNPPAKGETIFNKTCSTCHGTYGEKWTYPNKIVKIRNTITALRPPICAARTASTMVKLLHIKTAVLAAPITTSSVLLASANTPANSLR